MSKNISFVILSFTLLTSVGIFLYLNNITTVHQQSIAGIKTSTAETTVSLSVGEFHFTLFGYTSPQAKVTISGLGIYDETYADESGYFIFRNRFSPFSPREACLTAQDVLGRLSMPLCLPPFPTVYNVEIGPVIMPPTVSADVGEYFVGDEAMLSGQTIPNTEVNLSMFTKSEILNPKSKTMTKIQNPNDQNLLSFENWNLEFVSDFVLRISNFMLINPVNAFSFPQLQTKSDEKGNFSISIPTNNPISLRTFARTSFENSLSAKSLTLNIRVLPWWMIIFKIFGLVFDFLKKHWLEIGLLTEFIVLTSMVFNHLFHPHRLIKTRAIVLRRTWAITRID